MKQQTIKLSRTQALRLKLGLRVINLGVKLCGEKNQSLMQGVVSQMKKQKDEEQGA